MINNTIFNGIETHLQNLNCNQSGYEWLEPYIIIVHWFSFLNNLKKKGMPP